MLSTSAWLCYSVDSDFGALKAGGTCKNLFFYCRKYIYPHGNCRPTYDHCWTTLAGDSNALTSHLFKFLKSSQDSYFKLLKFCPTLRIFVLPVKTVAKELSLAGWVGGTKVLCSFSSPVQDYNGGRLDNIVRPPAGRHPYDLQIARFEWYYHRGDSNFVAVLQASFNIPLARIRKNNTLIFVLMLHRAI